MPRYPEVTRANPTVGCPCEVNWWRREFPPHLRRLPSRRTAALLAALILDQPGGNPPAFRSLADGRFSVNGWFLEDEG